LHHHWTGTGGKVRVLALTVQDSVQVIGSVIKGLVHSSTEFLELMTNWVGGFVHAHGYLQVLRIH